MIITKKHLPRRTMLRGIGAMLALPLLDGMVPALTALAATAAKPVRRLGVVYLPNGMIMPAWTPTTEGAGFALPPTLSPLAPFRDRLLVLSGLDCAQGDALGDGAGDHSRGSAVFLTAVHPRRAEGAGIEAGVSMDQIAAKALGKETQLASLEVALQSSEFLGSCDPGYSCAYSSTVSWRSPTTPLPMENDPRALFEHLFRGVDSTDPQARSARMAKDRSILDFVTREAADLQKGLGPHDRAKVSEYLEAIRDVERRIQKAEEQSARELPVMEQPASIPASFEEHAKLMFDLQVLAYQTDLTRVATFMIAREQSNTPYPGSGVADPHHSLTHHQGDEEKIVKVIKINVYHMTMFAYYLEKLRSTPDGDGSLLDHVMILYGGGISDGNLHTHDSLPILLVGGGAGQIQGNRHLRYPKGTPLANLHVSLLDKMGIPTDTFGDSTGPVDHLSSV